MKNSLMFSTRYICINGHEKLGGGGEAPEEREPTLQDAQTEEGRKRIIKTAEDFVAKLEKESGHGDTDAETKAQELRDIMEKYRLEGYDPIHDFSPDSKAKALANHAKELFNTMNTIKKDVEREKRKNRGIPIAAPPKWLRKAVLETPVNEFKTTLDEAIKRLNDFRENPYTNMIVDRSGSGKYRNPYLLDIYNRLAELDIMVNTAKTPAEVEKATREVLRIASPRAINETMQSDWAYALVANEVGDVIKSGNNMAPKDLLRKINARVARLAERDPLKSQPANAVYRMQYRGIDLSVAKTGEEKYTASIDGIDEYYEHLHPKIAQYVHDREEESGNRRA